MDDIRGAYHGVEKESALLRVLEHLGYVVVIDDRNITNPLFDCFDLCAVITLWLSREVIS